MRARDAAEDALDRRDVAVAAPVADLHVLGPRQPAVGRVGAGPARLAAAVRPAAAPRSTRASAPRPRRRRPRRPTSRRSSPRRSAPRSRGRAAAPARGARSPGTRPRRPPAGPRPSSRRRSPPRGTRSDRGSPRTARARWRPACRPGSPPPARPAPRASARSTGCGQQVLGGRAAVARVAERRPRPAERLRRLLGRHARADVDRQVLVRARDAELDHLRAEVVGVPVQPRLGVDGDAEVLELLGRRRWRASPAAR